jgi:hypothetical protein
MNMPDLVNINQQKVLERDLANVLGRLLDEVSWLRGWRVETETWPWDLEAAGPLPDGRNAVLRVECKSASFAPSQFSGLTGRKAASEKGGIIVKVLAMPRISRRMAELCRQQEWSWFDLAGNCRIEIGGVLLIDRSGREPVELPPRDVNLGTPEAGRVVRALLAPENRGKRWTQREIVGHFSERRTRIPPPSLALVNKVVQHLRDQAFLEQLPNRGFVVRDYEGLLGAWRQDYRFDRHQRLPYFTLLSGKTLYGKLRTGLAGDESSRFALAAFSAAEIQAPAVRQPRLWIFLRRDSIRDFEAALEAKQVDSGENIIVLIPDDLGVFYQLDTGHNRPACTNPAQTYVDLMSSGGRGEEAAEALLAQRLRPAWEAR